MKEIEDMKADPPSSVDFVEAIQQNVENMYTVYSWRMRDTCE